MNKTAQRSLIKVSVALNKTPTDIHNDLVSVYGDLAYSYQAVAKWAAAFKSGRESIRDESQSGRPVTESTNANINMVEQLIDENLKELSLMPRCTL